MARVCTLVLSFNILFRFFDKRILLVEIISCYFNENESQIWDEEEVSTGSTYSSFYRLVLIMKPFMVEEILQGTWFEMQRFNLRMLFLSFK